MNSLEILAPSVSDTSFTAGVLLCIEVLSLSPDLKGLSCSFAVLIMGFVGGDDKPELYNSFVTLFVLSDEEIGGRKDGASWMFESNNLFSLPGSFLANPRLETV